MADPNIILGIAGLGLTAATGIGGLLFALDRWAKDAPDLQVSLTNGFLTYPNGTLSESMVLMIEAVNTGRRPITVTSAGIELKDRRTVAFLDSYPPAPYELTDGQKILFVADMRGLARLPDPANLLDRAFVADATGQRHHAPVPDYARQNVTMEIGEYAKSLAPR